MCGRCVCSVGRETVPAGVVCVCVVVGSVGKGVQVGWGWGAARQKAVPVPSCPVQNVTRSSPCCTGSTWQGKARGWGKGCLGMEGGRTARQAWQKGGVGEKVKGRCEPN